MHRTSSRRQALSVNIRSEGGDNTRYMSAINDFATDLNATELFDKVALKTTLPEAIYESAEVSLALMPARYYLPGVNDNGINIETLHLSGIFSRYHYRRNGSRTLQMHINEITLDGYRPDNTDDAKRTETILKHGHAFEKATGTLPKAQRHFKIPLDFVLDINLFRNNAAAFLLAALIEKQYLDADLREKGPSQNLPSPQGRINHNVSRRRNHRREAPRTTKVAQQAYRA